MTGPGRSLTSEKNPLLREIRRCAGRGTVTDHGYAIAEGPHLLEEAVAAELELGAVIVAEGAEALARSILGSRGADQDAAGPRLMLVSGAVFATLSTTESPQGILSLVRCPVWGLEDLLSDTPLIVVLDAVQDPGNAGAILRAAEAFDATGAVFLKGSVHPYNPKCLRASAGSVFRLPLVAGLTADDLLGSPQSAGLRLFAADARASTPVSEARLDEACAIVIGSEGRGVDPKLAGAAQAVSIPTRRVESLNAAVAAGVVLYEARRRRGGR